MMCIVYIYNYTYIIIYICHIVSRLVQPRRYKAAVPGDDASIQFHGGFRGRRGTEGYNGGASLHRHPGGSPWLNKDSTGRWLMVVNGGSWWLMVANNG